MESQKENEKMGLIPDTRECQLCGVRGECRVLFKDIAKCVQLLAEGDTAFELKDYALCTCYNCYRYHLSDREDISSYAVAHMNMHAE